MRIINQTEIVKNFTNSSCIQTALTVHIFAGFKTIPSSEGVLA